MKSHLLSCWREYFDSTFTYCAHCAKQAVAYSMHSQNLCCRCQAASTSVSGTGTGTGSGSGSDCSSSSGSVGSVSAFALCSHCGLFRNCSIFVGKTSMCRHADFVAVSRGCNQSQPSLCQCRWQESASRGGEWRMEDRICGSGTESGQTNQLAG